MIQASDRKNGTVQLIGAVSGVGSHELLNKLKTLWCGPLAI